MSDMVRAGDSFPGAASNLSCDLVAFRLPELPHLEEDNHTI